MRSSATLLVGIVVAACGPKVIAFHVEPRRICTGDSVTVTYEVRGTPRLVVTEQTSDTAIVTTYRVVVERHGKSVNEPADVITIKPDSTRTFMLNTGPLGLDSLIATNAVEAGAWSASVAITTVSTTSARPMLVRHAGTEAVIGPTSAASAAWRGQSVSGPWELRTALLPSERPTSANRFPAAHLYLRVGLACHLSRGNP